MKLSAHHLLFSLLSTIKDPNNAYVSYDSEIRCVYVLEVYFSNTWVCIKRATNVFSSHYLSDTSMKTFKIGNDRSLKLNKKNDCISIEDKGTKKAAYFTPARWASFLPCLDQIDDQLRRLYEGEDVAYCMHYGGAWHTACIMVVHGTYHSPKAFAPSTCENFSYPRTRTRGSLQRPASLGVSTSGQRSSRLPRSYVMTTRPSQALRRVSWTWITALQHTVRSAIRIRLRFRHSFFINKRLWVVVYKLVFCFISTQSQSRCCHYNIPLRPS